MSGWTLLGQMSTRTTYELARLQDFTERWHYLALGVACLAVAAIVVYLYRRDSVELRPGAGVLLLVLRLAALAGVLFYFLDLEKRTERKITHNSRVLMLIDTSLSMGLRDEVQSPGSVAEENRLAEVIRVLDREKLVEDLRKKHDDVVLRFDSETGRVASLTKLPDAGSADTNQKDDASAKASNPTAIDWSKALAPQGVETRLGQTIRQLIADEQATPIAGVVVFTDGGQNAGIDPSSAVEAAREAKIPIFTVGVGSDRRPTNVRISDLAAPARAYPGDSFVVTGFIQSQGLDNRTVTVELASRPAGDDGNRGEPKLEDAQRITLAASGERVPVKFEITPDEIGRRTFQLKVKAPPEDNNSADDVQDADVEIVDRQTKVLLVASGPTRDYIFLRNQLRRDKGMVVDVWLQSAGEGISQDANQILSAFPGTAQELFEYDCVVAFDPDWKQLDEAQIDTLERWVGEKAGGLIAIAGPVQTDNWVQDEKLSKIRALYPVEFRRRLALEDGRYGSEIAWPIDFTREGVEAEFLWLGDSASSSQQTWSSFPGVYGYYSVRNAKSAATVYGRYSDPQAASGDQQPVYFAGQFYGSGRVFYMGSGEMWRLRRLDDSYFEQFYTKLIRHVSQGRLLLGSARGMLLADRDRYTLGSTVSVRAQLSDAQFEPLDAPSVPLQVIPPQGAVMTVPLAADPTRKGMFAGQFTALSEGAYRLQLAVPGSEDEELSRRVQVRVPDLELENPQRNDALLSEIASHTGGRYYVEAETVLGRSGVPALASVLPDRQKVTYLAGIPDESFKERSMTWILGVICGALSLEWLLRRLLKLA